MKAFRVFRVLGLDDEKEGFGVYSGLGRPEAPYLKDHGT